MAEKPEVVAVPSLDLPRYLGRWYEICRLPLKYEDATATDAPRLLLIGSCDLTAVASYCSPNRAEAGVAAARPAARVIAQSRFIISGPLRIVSRPRSRVEADVRRICIKNRPIVPGPN